MEDSRRPNTQERSKHDEESEKSAGSLRSSVYEEGTGEGKGDERIRNPERSDDAGLEKVLCVKESNESIFRKAMKREIVESRGLVENRFQLSELPSYALAKTLPRRSSISASMQVIITDRIDELLKLGADYEEKEDYTKALVCYSKACNLDPTVTACYTAKGELYLKLCDYQSSIIYYKKACILEPENEKYFSRLAFLFYLKGQGFLDNKDFSAALECFSKSVDIRPDIWTYHTRSMVCMAAQRKYRECFDIVNQRLNIEKDNPDLLLVRARLHRMFGNCTLAYYDAQDALKIDPDHKEAQGLIENSQKRGQALLEEAKRMDYSGNIMKALANLSSAIETDPEEGKFHSYRASLHRRSTDYNAAIDDLLIALDKSNHDETHVVHGEVHRQLLLTYNDFSVECFRKGYFEEAISLLNKALKIQKDEKTLYLNRGDCFYQTRELHFALSDYLQALELKPNDSNTLFRLSIVYNDLGIHEFQQKRFVQAEDFFSTSIHYQPLVPMYYLSRARTRHMLKDMDAARVDVISALHLNVDEKSVASLFSRLFPSQYKSEVLCSEFGTLVKAALDSVIDDIELERSDKTAADTEDSATPLKREPLAEKSAKEKVVQRLQECLEARDFCINIIQEKKKLKGKVEAVMNHKDDFAQSQNRLMKGMDNALTSTKKTTWKWSSSNERKEEDAGNVTSTGRN